MIVTLKPSLSVSDAQAQAIVDRIAPGRRIARVGALLAGEISAVFEIELADGPPGFVLKVYPETLHWKMRKEIRIADMLDGRLSVPTPRILLADDSKSLLDLNFVMTRLEGQNLLRHEPAPSEAHSVFAQMGRALREIHAIQFEAFGYIGADGLVTPFASNRAYMLSQFERKVGGFAQLAGWPALAERLKAYVERSVPLLDACTTPRLCHYDFHTGNVLARRLDGRLQLSGIVDLENAIAGDPLMDLAKTIAYSVRDDATKRAGLLEGYGPI
ncbi:MAG TPA: aminoglycoside phosphotransferase family protein, partial [Reyranella sp.]